MFTKCLVLFTNPWPFWLKFMAWAASGSEIPGSPFAMGDPVVARARLAARVGFAWRRSKREPAPEDGRLREPALRALGEALRPQPHKKAKRMSSSLSSLAACGSAHHGPTRGAPPGTHARMPAPANLERAPPSVRRRRGPAGAAGVALW